MIAWRSISSRLIAAPARWRAVSAAAARIADIHFGPPDDSPHGKPSVDPAVVVAIGAVGLLILAMATTSFVALMTARAGRRGVEVAVRKACGAGRHQLLAQFLGGSLLVMLVALILGMGLVERPGYSSNVSIVDQNAQVEKIMKEKQALVAQAGQIAEQSQREADTLAASQKRRKDRMKREKEVAPALEEWIGRSEGELTSAFGPPASSSENGALRALVYRRTYRETYDAQVGQVGKTGYFEKRENQFHCDLTLGFRNGLLEDYFTEGDRCQILWGPK